MALPVTDSAPPVTKLPPETLPVADTIPAVVKLPPDTLPVAATTPVVFKFPAVALPDIVANPPMFAFPLAVRLVVVILAGKSITSVCEPEVYSAGDGKLFAPIPILNVEVETSTLYTFALTTTLV